MLRNPEGATVSGHDAIGPRIRAARLADGRSLRQLASQVGVSASLLSQVENSKVQPSVATLYALVSALGISVDSVLGVASDDERPGEAVPFSPETGRGASAEVPPWTDTRIVVQHRNENPTLDMDNGVRWERLSGSNDGLEILLVTYQAGASSSIDGKLMRHSGHEFAYIIEGNLTVQVGFDVFEVASGDSFNFDSTLPHMYINRSDKAARGIWYTAGRRSDLPAAFVQEASADASPPEGWRLPPLRQ